MGLSAVVAGVAMLGAAGLLITFFITGSELADRFSNWFFALLYLAMIWTVVETHLFYVEVAPLIWVATVVCALALIVLLVTTLMVVLGDVEFQRVAIAQTFGFLVLVLWVLVVSILILVEGGLSGALGWLGIAASGVTVVTLGSLAGDKELMRGERRPGAMINGVFSVVLIGLTIWLIWLGLAPTISV